MAKRRPFHETIVDQIRDETDYAEDLEPLGRLILATKIPKNHDAIIATWKERIKGTDDDNGFLASVLIDLEKQKQEAEAEAKEMAERDEAMLMDQVRREERLMRDDIFEH